MDLAHLSSQGNKDGTSVKENIGHLYNKRLFSPHPPPPPTPTPTKKKKKKIMFNTLTIQSLRNVNEPKKAFKVNVELYKIAQNQYFSSSHNILTYHE